MLEKKEKRNKRWHHGGFALVFWQATYHARAFLLRRVVVVRNCVSLSVGGVRVLGLSAGSGSISGIGGGGGDTVLHLGSLRPRRPR